MQKLARFPLVDVLRGSAIVLMFIYHFSYDLTYFRLASFDFYRDPFWLNFRTLIVSLFLGIMGVSLHLATRKGIRWRSFNRRLVLIGAYALLVSVGSYLMFPRSMIFFGILHFVFVASLLGLFFINLYWTNLWLGVGLIIIGVMFANPFFDQSGWRIVGLMTHKPITEDYVPLLPWFGVVLVGMFLGRLVFTRRALPAVTDWNEDNAATRLLAFGGRHSLHIYMLHQPVFIGLLFLWVSLLR